MATFIVYFVWIMIAIGGYVVGVFGFCNIVGSLQTRQRMYPITIVTWVLILIAVYVLVKWLLPFGIAAVRVSYIIAFISTLLAGKIQ